MFTLENVTKIYRKGELEKIALADANLVLPDAGMVFIIGKSGSGKSTLLNAVSGLDTFSSGRISYNGHDYSSLSGKDFDDLHNKEFCCVFQDYCLIEGLSVKENIALGALQKAKRLKKPIRELLKRVGLEGYGRKKARQLSGGEKQRVAIARALIKNPKVLFCDEPTGNLDHFSTIQALRILKDASKDALVLIVTHDINIAYEFGDRVITLQDGRIVQDRSCQQKEGEGPSLYSVSPGIYTSEKEINEINSSLREKRISGVTSRYDCFQETKAQAGEETRAELPKGNKISCRSTVFRMFNKKPFKMGMLALLTSCVASLLALSFSIQDFSKESYFNKNKERFQGYSVARKVDYETADLDAMSASPLNKITQQDLDVLEKATDLPYSEMYRTVFGTGPGSATAIYTRLQSPQDFYLSDSAGLLFTSPALLESALGVSHLDYLALSDDPKPYGVYITDYFADSYFQRSGRQVDYSALLEDKLRQKKFREFYVNGVIETNYKQRLKTVYESLYLRREGITPEFRSQHQMELAFMVDYLSPFYNFDMDGASFFAKENSANIPATMSIALTASNESATSVSTVFYPRIGLSDKLSDDEVSLGQYFSGMLFSKDFSNASDFDAALSTLPPSVLNFNTCMQGADPYLLQTNRLYCLESHPELGNEGEVLVSPKVFEELKERYYYPIKIYFDPSTDFIKLHKTLDQTTLDFSDSSFLSVQYIMNSLSSFSDIFKILTVAALVAMTALASFYALDLIKGEKYDVGVLKSLGIGNRVINGQIVLSVLLFALINAAFFAPFYFVLANLAVKILNRSLSGTYFSYGPVIASCVHFDPFIYLVVNLIEVGLVLLISLALAIYLSRFKPITIIRNKD